MQRNNPKDSRKYNYVYKITNNVNQKEYVGVHRTDKLEDGYMGSGRLMKRAIAKHGKDNFTKTILSFFPSYEEALIAEKEIVTLDYANREDTYNLREGGYGPIRWSDKGRELLSVTKSKQWADPIWKATISAKIYTASRAEKISRALIGIKRPNMHNTNPEKIRKTADRHRGMKRSPVAKSNMSIAALKLPNDIKERRSGAGMVYIYNAQDGTIRRHIATSPIPNGWVRGSGPKNVGLNLCWIYNSNTQKIRKWHKDCPLPTGWAVGRASKTNG